MKLLANDKHVIKYCHVMDNIFYVNNYYDPALLLITRRNNNCCSHHVMNDSVLSSVLGVLCMFSHDSNSAKSVL